MLPYLQVEADFLATKAYVVAALLRVHRHMVVGMAADLFAFAIAQTSSETKPPDGLFPDEAAPAILEAVMGWQGEPGAAIEAFTKAGVLERLGVGVRVRGMDRYAAYWEKAERNRQRKAEWRRLRASRKDVPRDVPGTETGTEPLGPRGRRPGELDREKESSSTKKKGGAAGQPPHVPQAGDLEQRLADAFHSARGVTYRRARGDFEALRGFLLEGVEPDEVVRRFACGLRRTAYPRVSTVAELAQHWNHCTADEPPRKGLTSNTTDAEFHEKTRHLEVDENGDLVL